DETAYVLTGNADIHHPDVNPRLVTRIADRLFNRVNSLVDVEYNPFYHTFGLGLAHAKHFKLAEFIFAAHDDTDLGCAYIEPDYYFFLFHGCCISGCYPFTYVFLLAFGFWPSTVDFKVYVFVLVSHFLYDAYLYQALS